VKPLPRQYATTLADNGGQHRRKQKNKEKTDKLPITIKTKKQ
jgi:hypothetical protein